MTGDEIHDLLVELESQTMELAEKVIMTAAAIRARLTLLELAVAEKDYFERREER